MSDEQKPDIGLRSRQGRCASCPKRTTCRCEFRDGAQNLTTRLQQFIVRDKRRMIPVYDRYGRMIGTRWI
jgi:hypothetical protein